MFYCQKDTNPAILSFQHEKCAFHRIPVAMEPSLIDHSNQPALDAVFIDDYITDSRVSYFE